MLLHNKLLHDKTKFLYDHFSDPVIYKELRCMIWAVDMNKNLYEKYNTWVFNFVWNGTSGNDNVLCTRDYKKTDSVEMGGETKQEV